jgi:hypothetical protein
MKNLLPSKKFTIISASVLLVLVVIFIATNDNLFPDRDYKKEQERLAETNIALGQVIYQDADNDGLFDWEESLWGTDPENPDSDGDGILDGQEVAAQKEEASDEELSNTELFARELFSTVVALNQTGNLTLENLDSVVEGFDGLLNKPLYYEKYSNLSVDFVETTPETQNVFKDDFTQIMTRYRSTKIGDELEYIALYLENPVDHQQDIEEIVELYSSIAQELSFVKTPNEIADRYIKLLNSFDQNGQIIQEMMYLNEDSIKGLSAIIQYEKVNSELIFNLRTINRYNAQI